jgi:hypothetical protein
MGSQYIDQAGLELLSSVAGTTAHATTAEFWLAFDLGHGMAMFHSKSYRGTTYEIVWYRESLS